MLDLHCHLLPAVDDGAVDLDMALEMARMAVADGIEVVACTPHIYPGLYENTRPLIEQAVAELRRELDARGIELELVVGADVHLTPDLPSAIRSGRVPTLGGSRYLLLEPPHHTAPPRFEDSLFELMAAGYTPVLTHPERLSWVEEHYAMFARLSERGVWMQVTAGALTGRFGRRVQYWGERFVDEGHCMVLATDAHHPVRRPPLLAEAVEAAARRVGSDEARHMVFSRPRGILENADPHSLPSAVGSANGQMQPAPEDTGIGRAFLRRLRGKA